MFQSSLREKKNINPIIDGIRTFIKKRNIEALKAAELASPKYVRKNTAAPSLIPSSPIETGGITVLANIIKLPAHKYPAKFVLCEKAETSSAN